MCKPMTGWRSMNKPRTGCTLPGAAFCYMEGGYGSVQYNNTYR